MGCADALKYGDKLIITISPVGNLRVTYQVGDQFRVAIINGAPAQLGGGRTGTDTQTWRVRGSVLGGLTDYSLYKPSPGTYSASGITFKITPGGIDDALGDEFEWYVEGGQFRYRKNGGVWSSNTQITTAAITIDSANGAAVGVQFTTGAAPSFVVGDSYSFRTTALHTVDRICSPVHGGTFDINGGGLLVPDDFHFADPTAAVGGVYETILFVRASAECTVYVTPRDGGFSYPQLPYACTAGDNVFVITDDIRVFEITHLHVDVLNDGGDYTPVTMLWLGHPTELAMPNDIADPGITRKRIKLGNRSRAVARLGANIQHSAVAESSFDDFVDLLNDAAVNHDGRFAVVWPAGSPAECGIARFTGDELEIEDELDYQPADSADRLLKFTLPLEAVA